MSALFRSVWQALRYIFLQFRAHSRLHSRALRRHPSMPMCVSWVTSIIFLLKEWATVCPWKLIHLAPWVRLGHQNRGEQLRIWSWASLVLLSAWLTGSTCFSSCSWSSPRSWCDQLLQERQGKITCVPCGNLLSVSARTPWASSSLELQQKSMEPRRTGLEAEINDLIANFDLYFTKI